MKKKIALVTGGYSGEAVISYKSALTIQNNIDSQKWDCYKIDINPAGWFYEENDKKYPVDKNDFSVTLNGTKINFDAVLIGLHGTPGEDTRCDAASSALTFNKRYTVAVASFAGMSVAKSMHLIRGIPVSINEITKELKLPVFVKPNNGGSSIGMSKVKEVSELETAVEKAFKEDDQVLVEEFISGREFTIGVFESKGEIIALPITEIIPKKEFFDYEAKYEGASDEITPAQVEETKAEKIRIAARKAYAIFNCKGIVRIDFIYNEADGKPYLLELNTVPGQTEASLVPQQVKAMGMTLKEFYTKMIEECFQ